MLVKTDLYRQMFKFVLFQGVILAGVMAFFLVLCSFFFVQKAVSLQHQKIEDGLLAFTQQAAQSSEIPKRGDLGEQTFFILTEDGKYVLPRLSRSDDGEKLWQEYELKLIYEMQKRRDGWAFYPDRSGRSWDEGQYAVRYIFLSKQGWIVAAQEYIPSAHSLLRGFFTPQFWGWFGLVLCAAFGAVFYNAFWHFQCVTKMILHSQQEDFIAVPGGKSSVPERTMLVSAEGIKPDGIDNRGILSESLPVAQKKPESPLKPPVPLTVRALNDSRGTAERLLKSQLYHQEPEPDHDGHQKHDNLGEVIIDTVGIKSSLLRRVIEEMREIKKPA